MKTLSILPEGDSAIAKGLPKAGGSRMISMCCLPKTSIPYRLQVIYVCVKAARVFNTVQALSGKIFSMYILQAAADFSNVQN